jgi:hypothetical protein
MRHAGVASAEAALTQAKAGETLIRLEVQNVVATAFLNVAAAHRGVVAAEADVDRRNVRFPCRGVRGPAGGRCCGSRHRRSQTRNESARQANEASEFMAGSASTISRSSHREPHMRAPSRSWEQERLPPGPPDPIEPFTHVEPRRIARPEFDRIRDDAKTGPEGWTRYRATVEARA